MSAAVGALGDSALLLPVSAALLLYLLLLREGRLALGFAAALAAGGGATVGAKLLFRACGTAITDFDVVSPSGHASFAAIVYGALALLLGAGRPRPVRAGLAAGAALLVLAIGASRVRTGAHSPSEVLIGLALGAAALAVFLLVRRRVGRPTVPAWPVAAGFALALLLVGGSHFSLEGRIATAARRIADTFDICAPPHP